MGNVNVGSQQITFKYSTPLQADYLNIMFNKVSSAGLCSRPWFVCGEGTDESVPVTIGQFSAVVHPTDDNTNPEKLIVDENGVAITTRMVKVSTQSTVNTNIIPNNTCAIGFTYSFTTNESSLTPQWYGSFEPLSKEQAQNYKGIIVATVMTREVADTWYTSITTSGADISDLLLKEEGWDCCRWLSLISPRRLSNGNFNRFELRRHNELWNGYMNGHAGCVSQNALIITVPDTTGIMKDGNDDPMDYSLVKHNSEGLTIAQQSTTMPISKTDGGIIALIDSTIPIAKKAEQDGSSFTNQAVIKPCLREEINIYVDQDCLMIR